jgi:hypothetical protein
VKITSQEFCARFLPQNWKEADLQQHIRQQLKKGGLLIAPEENRIKTKSATRRSDVETWLIRYEVKKWLTYENIYRAAGQLLLYRAYGRKILWVFNKREVIIGLAPVPTPDNPNAYWEALKLARDFRAIGIEVIFINEAPEWLDTRMGLSLEKKIALGGLVTVALASFSIALLLAAL